MNKLISALISYLKQEEASAYRRVREHRSLYHQLLRLLFLYLAISGGPDIFPLSRSISQFLSRLSYFL